MGLFQSTQPKIEEANINKQPEQVGNEDFESKEKELEALARKVRETKDGNDIYEYEEKMHDLIKTEEDEIKSEIKELENVLPTFRGRGKSDPKQLEIEDMLARRQIALRDGITRGDMEYRYLEQADLLPNEVKDFEKDLKLPSMDLIATHHVNALNESLKEGVMEDIDEEKKKIASQLEYIMVSSEIENKISDQHDQSITKAAYSRKYKISPIVKQDLEGNIQYIKETGMKFDDIGKVTEEDLKNAEDELERESKKKGFNLRKHFEKHNSKYKGALAFVIMMGALAGAAHAMDPGTSDLESRDQKNDDKNVGDSEDKQSDESASSRASTEKTATTEPVEDVDKKTADTQTAEQNKDSWRVKAEIAKAGEIAQEKDSSAKVDSDKKAESGKASELEKIINDTERMKLATVDGVDGNNSVSTAIVNQLIGSSVQFEELDDGRVGYKDFDINEDHLRENGYDDDMTSKDKIFKWAQNKAAGFVKAHGYYDTDTGEQTHVTEKNKSAYVLDDEKIIELHNDTGKFTAKDVDEGGGSVVNKKYETTAKIKEIKEILDDGEVQIENMGKIGLGGVNEKGEFDYKPIDLGKNKDLPYNLKIYGANYPDGSPDDSDGDSYRDGPYTGKLFLADSEKDFDGDRTIYSVTLDKKYSAKDAIADIKDTIKEREEDFGEMVSNRITSADAQSAGINLFGKYKISEDNEKLKFWLDSGISLSEPEKVKRIFDIADAHDIEPGGYARVADNLKTIDNTDLSQARKAALEEIFFDNFPSNEAADKSLGKFFGKDNYEGIKGWSKGLRSIESDNKGTVISFDQAGLVPNWIDQIKVIIGRDGNISMERPGLDVKPAALNDDSLNNITKKIYSFMQKEMPRASEEAEGANNIAEDDEPAAEEENVTEKEVKKAPEAPSSEDTSEKEGTEKLSKKEMKEAVKLIENSELDPKEKESLKEKKNNPIFARALAPLIKERTGFGGSVLVAVLKKIENAISQESSKPSDNEGNIKKEDLRSTIKGNDLR